MIIKAARKRTENKPTTRELNEAAGVIPSKVIERVADAAILGIVTPYHEQSTISITMNSGRILGSTPAAPVKVNTKLLLAARELLEDRIARAKQQHENSAGPESEKSATATRSAVSILTRAIRTIDKELPIVDETDSSKQ